VRVVLEWTITGRPALQLPIEDVSSTPSVGDQVLVVGDLVPTVTRVLLNLRLTTAWVTLSDPGVVTDEVWQAVNENFGLDASTPDDSRAKYRLTQPFDPSDLSRSHPHLPLER
jgi:hypothetical protein